MIKANILLDSINGSGNRITTWLLTYNRFIHAEFLTHRVFSRNASSSRAIPVKKMIEDVRTNPAMPVFWGKNQAGMQAKEQLDDTIKNVFRSTKDAINEPFTALGAAKYDWLAARDKAIETVEGLVEIGLHKQIANRILEPWMHITVIATATDMGNFFALRAHQDAQPEFQALAYLMLEEYNKSIPTQLVSGAWHIPFGDRMPLGIDLSQRLKISTARCARTSYLTFDGEINPEKDYQLHDQLATSGHWSPFEHCAQAQWHSGRSGNFQGWTQYRKSFLNENRGDDRIKIPTYEETAGVA
jgi:thymidylate synthase ThyX